MGSLLQLVFEIGFPLGAHHHHVDIRVMVDLGNHVVSPQHVLVAQITNRQFGRVVTDGHGGDDLLTI